MNETAFFLEKIREEESTYRLDVPQFYLSAFLSACRSITFALQSSLSDLDGFIEWYELKQKELKSNKLAKFFLISRNESQKIGFLQIGSGSSFIDLEGNRKMKLYFQRLAPTQNDYIPEADVVTVCETHFKTILNLVLEVFIKFGNHIDSQQFFTIENMKKLNLTIEDLEEQAGYPRGWLNIGYGTLEEKVNLLRKSQSPPYIDRIFIRYLGKNRFGEKID